MLINQQQINLSNLIQSITLLQQRFSIQKLIIQIQKNIDISLFRNSQYRLFEKSHTMDNNRRSSKLKTSYLKARNTQTQNRSKSKSKNDVAKSINIMPLKIKNTSQKNKQVQFSNITIANVNSSKNINSLLTSKNSIEKYAINKKKNVLLSYKSKPSLRLDFNSQEIASLQTSLVKDQNVKTQKKLFKNNIHRKQSLNLVSTQQQFKIKNNLNEDLQHLMEKLQKNKQMKIYDNKQLLIQLSKFKSLIDQLQTTRRQQDQQNKKILQKNSKYQFYFKQLRLSHIPSQIIQNKQNKQVNYQLKILNLQKKIETLNYIIRQYRINNNDQIKEFQSKLKDFKLNIQLQLTQRLAQTNQKVQSLTNKVRFYQKWTQENNQCHWNDLTKNLLQTKQQNQKKTQYIKELKKQIQILTLQLNQNILKTNKFDQLQARYLQEKLKVEQLTDLKLQLQQKLQSKQMKIDQMNHRYQQITYQLQGMKNLNLRIQNKEKTIKKNTIAINRLQCQNIQLKTKMNSVLGQFQNRIFSEKNLQQNLLAANNTIQELTTRLHETFLDFDHQQGNDKDKQQKSFFISHIFDRTKSAYNQIILQYQNQLKITQKQCTMWKQTFSLIQKNKNEKDELIKKTISNLLTIQQKAQKCSNIFYKITSSQNYKDNCIKCAESILYWGQMENLYGQVKSLLQKIITKPKILNQSNNNISNKQQIIAYII